MGRDLTSFPLVAVYFLTCSAKVKKYKPIQPKGEKIPLVNPLKRLKAETDPEVERIISKPLIVFRNSNKPLTAVEGNNLPR